MGEDFEDVTLPQAMSEGETGVQGAVGVQGAEDVDILGAGAVGVQEPPDEVGRMSGYPVEPTGRPKPLDPTLLQILSVSANLTLQEEEDTLGKVREGGGARTALHSFHESCR